MGLLLMLPAIKQSALGSRGTIIGAARAMPPYANFGIRRIRLQLAPLLGAFLLALWFGGIVAPDDAKAGAVVCSITSSNLAFGTVDVLPGTAMDATATMTVACVGGGGNGHRLCVSFGSGANFSGTQRQLSGPSGAVLNYQLYKDAARTTIWGSYQTGFAGTGLQLDVAQGATTNITVYARIAASQQSATVGSYSTSFAAEPFLHYDDLPTGNCPMGVHSDSASMTVTATVIPTCTVSASNMSFPASTLITANVDATSTISPRCNNGVPYTVSLGGGNSGATNPALRKMSKGAEQITYGLYRDASRSLPWGSTVGTNTVGGTATGSTQTIPVYGRVPPQTTGSPGSYSDSIVVSVDY